LRVGPRGDLARELLEMREAQGRRDVGTDLHGEHQVEADQIQ